MESLRLFVVEDQPKILKNQLKLLESFSDIQIVGTALSGEEALEELGRLQQPPDVILCDLGLPQMSGIDVTREVKRRTPSVEILIFTIFDEEDKVVEAIKAGAAGYLLKGAEAEKIVEAIKEVKQGGSVIQPSLARSLLRHFRMPEQGAPPPGMLKSEEEAQREREQGAPPPPSGRRALTERELECLQIIAKGLSNNEAARVLGLSKATIRTHLEHIYQKLDVTNRVEAVTEGIRQGIIDL
jgi:DNA-binding NarL/FixJ family response regulator